MFPKVQKLLVLTCPWTRFAFTLVDSPEMGTLLLMLDNPSWILLLNSFHALFSRGVDWGMVCKEKLRAIDFNWNMFGWGKVRGWERFFGGNHLLHLW